MHLMWLSMHWSNNTLMGSGVQCHSSPIKASNLLIEITVPLTRNSSVVNKAIEELAYCCCFWRHQQCMFTPSTELWWLQRQQHIIFPTLSFQDYDIIQTSTTYTSSCDLFCMWTNRCTQSCGRTSSSNSSDYFLPETALEGHQQVVRTGA